MPFPVTGKKLEIIILSEVREREKDKYRILLLTSTINSLI